MDLYDQGPPRAGTSDRIGRPIVLRSQRAAVVARWELTRALLETDDGTTVTVEVGRFQQGFDIGARVYVMFDGSGTAVHWGLDPLVQAA